MRCKGESVFAHVGGNNVVSAFGERSDKTAPYAASRTR